MHAYTYCMCRCGGLGPEHCESAEGEPQSGNACQFSGFFRQDRMFVASLLHSPSGSLVTDQQRKAAAEGGLRSRHHGVQDGTASRFYMSSKSTQAVYEATTPLRTRTRMRRTTSVGAHTVQLWSLAYTINSETATTTTPSSTLLADASPEPSTTRA